MSDLAAHSNATTTELRDEIDALTKANREARSAETERRLRDLRHQAGIRLLAEASEGSFPEPDHALIDRGPGVPEVNAEQLTPELLRAAILSKGCLLVRGVAPVEEAERMAADMERVLTAREQRVSDDGFYELIEVDEPYDLEDRNWVVDGGGFWAADSPRMMFEMLELFDRRGLQDVIRGYLGEPPAFSVQKCTLRKVPPTAGNGYPGWHQDGRFLGDVRALNVWMTLTHCGDDQAPGLDLVPRRIDEFLPTGTEGAVFNWVVAPDMVEKARAGTEIVRPVFEPGDVMLFDDRFLHSTAADPAMPNNRYAIESWFFGPSGFPERYAPLAL